MATTTRLNEPLAPSTTQGYSAPAAAKLAGVTYRQADHWERTRVLRPSAKSANGSGTSRRYSVMDVRVLAVLRELSRLGARLISLQLPTERIAFAIERGDRWLLATPDADIDSCNDEQLSITMEAAGTMGVWLLDLRSILAGVEVGAEV